MDYVLVDSSLVDRPSPKSEISKATYVSLSTNMFDMGGDRANQMFDANTCFFESAIETNLWGFLHLTIVSVWIWANSRLLWPHSNDWLGWKKDRREWFWRRGTSSTSIRPNSSNSKPSKKRIHGLHDCSIRRVTGPPRLCELAQDKRVLRTLKKFGLFVETLKELQIESGYPPELLGFNVGRGIEVCVRLRDERTGSPLAENLVLRILCHELAHNRHESHDDKFYLFERKLLLAMIGSSESLPESKHVSGRTLGWAFDSDIFSLVSSEKEKNQLAQQK